MNKIGENQVKLFPLDDQTGSHASIWFYMVLHSPPSCTK